MTTVVEDVLVTDTMTDIPMVTEDAMTDDVNQPNCQPSSP
jgi:hypothetical protein